MLSGEPCTPLEYLGLQNTFVKVFNSAETGVEKPHARAFLNVLDAFNPKTAWMIGDNPVADIAGAEAVGLPAILVRSKNNEIKHVCANLHGVEAFLTQEPEKLGKVGPKQRNNF